MDERKFCAAFGKIVELSMLLCVSDINKLPGCWEMQIDGCYRFAVNGHREAQTVEPPGCMRVEIPPFEAAVWRNGWLAMLINPYDGAVLGDNTEDEFIAAMETAIRSVPARA